MVIKMSIQQKTNNINVYDVVSLYDILMKNESSEIRSTCEGNGRQITTWLETLSSPDAIPKTDAKEITRLFLERFNTEALPQLHGNIYNRWVFTHHVEHKDIEFGKHYLESHPESPVVLKAIADFLLVHLVASLSSAYKQEDYERAQLIYSILPKKIQDRIEGRAI